MHVNTAIDFTTLFWIANIAACLSTEIVIFSFKAFFTISFFAALAITKASAWKTVLCLPKCKKKLICMRAVRVFYVETCISSSVYLIAISVAYNHVFSKAFLYCVASLRSITRRLYCLPNPLVLFIY